MARIYRTPGRWSRGLEWCRRMHVGAFGALWLGLWQGLGLPFLSAGALGCGLLAAGFALVEEVRR